MKLQSSTIGLVTALALAFACSDGGGLTGSGMKKASREEASGGEDESSEDLKTTEPQQVSGAWLACAFMDSQEEMMQKAKANAEAQVDIGCGVYDGNDNHIPLADLEWRWYLIDNKGQARELAGRNLPAESGLKIELPVSLRDLMGTIQVTIRNAAGATSARRKSITTINYYGARYGKFDVKAYRDTAIDGGLLLSAGEIPADGGGVVVPSSQIGPDGKPLWMMIVSFAFEVVREYAKTTGDEEIKQPPVIVHTGEEPLVQKPPQSNGPVANNGGNDDGNYPRPLPPPPSKPQPWPQGPGKPEPSKPDPGKPDPGKPDPGKPGPSQPDGTKPDGPSDGKPQPGKPDFPPVDEFLPAKDKPGGGGRPPRPGGNNGGKPKPPHNTKPQGGGSSGGGMSGGNGGGSSGGSGSGGGSAGSGGSGGSGGKT